LTNRIPRHANPSHYGSNSIWLQLKLITDGGNSSSTFLAASITPSHDAEAIMFDFANHLIPSA
jgi:hypothetical protein